MIHVYNFMAPFAALFEAGVKPHTIRALRADGRDPHPGDTLRFYTGRRTKDCKLIGEVTCIDVTEICILPGLPGRQGQVILGGTPLIDEAVALLARRDGFNDAQALFGFIEKHYGLPFTGQLISWDSHPRFRTWH